MAHTNKLAAGVGSTVEVAEIESLAKGALIVGDGTGAPSTVTAGTNNTVVTYDSSQSAGVKGATVDSLQSGAFGFFVGGSLSTGDGKAYAFIPSHVNGKVISAVHAAVGTAPAGAALSLALYNVTQAADILSTNLTIDDGETTSATAATAAVIDTAEDDLATNDVIRLDIDQVGSGTAGSDLAVTIEYS